MRDLGRFNIRRYGSGEEVITCMYGSITSTLRSTLAEPYHKAESGEIKHASSRVQKLSTATVPYPTASHCHFEIVMGPRTSSSRKQSGIVEYVNSLTASEFFKVYMTEISVADVPGCPAVEHIVLDSPKGLSAEYLDICLELIEATSADDYKSSEMKWSRSKKKVEMRLPDMKYIILLSSLPGQHESVQLAGFISFMVIYEDGHEVIYCYEIHLAEEWQGKGIGKKLMQIMEQIGDSVKVEKAMLTVFKSNKRALRMYESLGYVEDEFSPQPRKLRNGMIKEPIYVILSKQLNDNKPSTAVCVNQRAHCCQAG